MVLGCGLPEGATGHNVARNAALFAGFGVGVPGITVNRYCGSGLSAASFVGEHDRHGEIACDALPAASRVISLVQFNLNFNGFFYEPLQADNAGGVVDHEPDRRFRGREIRHQPPSA